MRSLIALALTWRMLGAIATQCPVVDVKSILKGCKTLMGLNVTTAGCISINDKNCNKELSILETIEEPLIQYSLANQNKFYTVLVVDPDAPALNNDEFFLHMIKINISGSALNGKQCGSKTEGTDKKRYVPPTPPPGTGKHRYMFLLFKQGDGSDFNPEVPLLRNNFNLEKWLTEKNLCFVAGTQFRVGFIILSNDFI